MRREAGLQHRSWAASVPQPYAAGLDKLAPDIAEPLKFSDCIKLRTD